MPGKYWMRTWSGRRFDFEDVRADAIALEDVAHGLSRICRFGGHVEGYFVAEHSVRVSELVEQLGGTVDEQRWGLHHDDPEAYVGDMIWPLKQLLKGTAYGDIERLVEVAVVERFGLRPREMPPIVKRADLVLLSTEKRDVAGAGHDASTSGETPSVSSKEGAAATDRLGEWACDDFAPLPERIVPWSMDQARMQFLRRHAELEAGQRCTCPEWWFPENQRQGLRRAPHHPRRGLAHHQTCAKRVAAQGEESW